MKKFVYTSYFDHGTNSVITKVFADIPKAAIDAIAKNEGWDGCHWDAPNIVYCEQLYGEQYMSDECDQLIRMLEATEDEIILPRILSATQSLRPLGATKMKEEE